MVTCSLCGESIGFGSIEYGTFGLIKGGFCNKCFKEVRALIDLNTFDTQDEFNSGCEKFLYDHGNSAPATAIVNGIKGTEPTQKAPASADSDSENSNVSNTDSDTGSNDYGLFSNPGKMLKAVAKTFFWICAIAGLIIGSILGNTETFFGETEFNFGLFLIPFISGLVIGYFGGLGLAAFGDLVVNVKAIKDRLSSK